MKYAGFWLLLGIILSISMVWEFSHAVMYVDHTGIGREAHLVIAAAADLFLVLSIISINTARRGSSLWMRGPGPSDHFLMIFLGMAIALGIEVFSLSLGRWDYTPLMPTLFGIGLSPLIQLAVTCEGSLLLWRKLLTGTAFKTR